MQNAKPGAGGAASLRRADERVPMAAPESALQSLTGEEFRDVIGHFATGVTVITAVEDEKMFGTTASAVSSLSVEPPMLVICMNRQSSTGACVGRVRRFAVNILNAHQGELAKRFATKAPDKFEGVELLTGRYGEPLLAQALAHVECHVVEEASGGTHTVFLAEVHRASAGTGTPLAYYRGQFGRLLVEDSPGHAIHDVVRGLCASELGAAALTVGQAPADELAELRRLAEEKRLADPDAALPPIEDLLAADQAFHSALIRLARSEALIATYERLAAAVPMAQWFAPGTGADRDLVTDNIRIVEAYERGDLVAASEAIRSHYLRTADLGPERPSG